MPSAWNPISGAPIEGAGTIYNSSFVQAVGYFSPWAGANYPVFPASSPFYSFSAETGYGGGDTSLSSLSNAGYGGGAGYDLSGYNITGSFVTEYYGSGPLAFPSEPWVFDPNYALPNSSFSMPNTTDVYFDLVGRGVFSPAASAGIAAAIVNESGGNPWISEIPDPNPNSWTGSGGRPGYGVFQFTDTRWASNRSDYEDFLTRSNLIDDIPAQVNFMLQIAPAALLDYLSGANIDRFDAMRAFSLGFEGGRVNFLGPLPAGQMGTNLARDMTVGSQWNPDPNRINPYSIGPMDDPFMP